MSVLVKGMDMPKSCKECRFCFYDRKYEPMCLLLNGKRGESDCPLVEIPPHGDLIDRDALIKDGWLSLHKEVIRMGGYAVHELPLANPSIPVIIPAEEGE